MICRKIQIFKNSRLLSQLKRNKESENVTVVLRFSPKQAKCNSFRTLFGTLRCVSFCILLYLYAPFCISWFLCTFCGASLCSLLRSFPVEQIGAAVQWPAQQLLYKNTKRPLHKNVQRPLTIQAMLLNNAQEQAITEQPLLPRSA